MQEEGFAEAQRVLLSEVSGEAVFALLQYLYTAVCQLTHTLLPDVLQLATRSACCHRDLTAFGYAVRFWSRVLNHSIQVRLRLEGGGNCTDFILA